METKSKRGPGRPPVAHPGKRTQFYIAPDVLAILAALPPYKRSEFVNQAVREKKEREG